VTVHRLELLDLIAALERERAMAEGQTCGQAIMDLAAKAPDCPKHPGTKMTYADGMELYHDLKHPHWRCELWIGSGVCGATRPLKADAEGGGR
jgi:hypothetical protein